MSEDLIRRSDAIKAVEAEEHLGYVECQADWLYDRINAIPSADRPSTVDLSSVYSTAYKSGYEKGKADRPQGEWKFSSTFTDSVGSEFAKVKCSHCGYETFAIARSVKDGNFCPNCGADMRAEQTEPQTYVINPQEPTNDEKCFECDDFFTCGGQCNKFEDEPQTETEVIRTIIHKMIDNTDLAEDAYPGLRQRLHDAVDEYEPQTDNPCDGCIHESDDEVLACVACVLKDKQTERSE